MEKKENINFYNNQYNNIGDLILFALDKEYKYIAFNARHQKIMKKIWNTEIKIGMNMLDLISYEQDYSKAKINFDRALQGESFSLCEEYGDKKFARIYYQDSYKPLIDEAGNIFGLAVYSKDISKLKNSETKLINQKQKILQAKKHVERSDRLKTEFLQNLSHEIRSPMNAILGFADFLETENLPKEKQRLYASIIKTGGNQLVKIIDDILEISALETKHVKILKNEFDLNKLLKELYFSFLPKAKEKTLSLYLRKDIFETQRKILCDENKLRKILSNLIENSIKFTKSGHIEINYNTDSHSLKLYVKDTGIGIDKKNFHKIFKRFSQENDKISKKTGGLGLGLSIAKEYTELLGGKISVESEKGKGACFFVTIPNEL